MKKVYCLYGVPDRDPEELCCMFFATKKDLNAFKKDLPMRKHRVMVLSGVDYEALEVVGSS